MIALRKSEYRLRKDLKALRRLVELELERDPILCRMAQAMETALLWATSTNSWHDMPSEARLMADLIKRDLEPRR